MARSKLPAPLDRRHLLQRDLDPAKALAYAQAYLDEGRMVEAVDFLAKAGANDKLQELLEAAIEQGDAFLLRAVAGGLDTTPGKAVWLQLAEAADAAGKSLYAETARRQAEIED